MNYNELLKEIEATKEAIAKSKSQFAKKDRKKYLERLIREKNCYELNEKNIK